MAMLAEPRQRKRYNLMPRGKALYEDETRFGTKMLEKMGWTKGQGLGANSNGSKNFVTIRYKNDALGLGFEERDDQWTQHDQGFDSLLKALNENGAEVNGEKENVIDSEYETQTRVGFGFQETSSNDKPKTKGDKFKEKISGISLEERSKQSKARLHYKKFTKGKDLSQYSEKDLANIFGKKSVDCQQPAVNDIFQQLNNIYGKLEDDTSGVQMINTGVSVNDYFKNKKESRKYLDNGGFSEENNFTSAEVELEGYRKDCNRKSDAEEEGKNKIFSSNVSMKDYFQKKMALKNKTMPLNAEEGIVNNIDACDIETKEISRKKKKSKKDKDAKNGCIHPLEQEFEKNKHIEVEENKEILTETLVLKKDKKSKKYDEKELAKFPENDCLLTKMVKKSRKNQNILNAENNDATSQTQCKQNEEKSKIIDNKELTGISPDECLLSPLEEKSKENKHVDVGANIESNEFDASVAVAKKPNKSKKKKFISNEEHCENSKIKADAVSMKEKQSEKCDEKETAELPQDDCLVNTVVKKVKRNKCIVNEEYNKSSEIKADTVSRKNEKCDMSGTAELHLDETVEKKSKKNKRVVVEEKSESTQFESDVPVMKKEKKSKKEHRQNKRETDVTDDDSKSKKRKLDNSCIEKALTDEPPKEMENDNETSDVTDTIYVDDSEEEKIAAASTNENVKPTNVSHTAKKVVHTDFQKLDLEEIQTQYKAFNIYPISSFCAEKFRITKLNDFTGSSLTQIEGYGIGADIQLQIKCSKFDEERITDLWNGVFSKYGFSGKKKNSYWRYIDEVVNARKNKQKIPKLNVKTWKRRNIFQTL